MPTYSHSQLSTYEECPLKYKLSYIDKIKRDTAGIEAFMGSMVHEALKKCYDDARLTRIMTIDGLLAYYDNLWQQNWHDEIAITKPDLTADHYRATGRKLLEAYHRRHAPFDADITLGTEKRLNFTLDDEGNYKMAGIIDRLARTADGVCWIHDYKTSAFLPSQADADKDRQLALYHIGIKRLWPDIKEIKLVWHYLAFDTELVSRRTPEAIAAVTADTVKVINAIESATEFPPGDSPYCDWCEYPDLCPKRKHAYKVKQLPPNKFLEEPGVMLVNRFAELKDKVAVFEDEMDLIREALIGYAKREDVTVIKGTGCQARLRFDKKLKFPGKNDEGRPELDETLKQAGKWLEVSTLDNSALNKAVGEKRWDSELIRQIRQFGKLEETSSIFVSKTKSNFD
jgi:putative RecB family exonuclease